MTCHAKRAFAYDLDAEEGDSPILRDKATKARQRRVVFHSDVYVAGSTSDEATPPNHLSGRARRGHEPSRAKQSKALDFYADDGGASGLPSPSPAFSPLERNSTPLQAQASGQQQPAWVLPLCSQAGEGGTELPVLERPTLSADTSWLQRGQAACDGIDRHAAAINASIAELERRCVTALPQPCELCSRESHASARCASLIKSAQMAVAQHAAGPAKGPGGCHPQTLADGFLFSSCYFNSGTAGRERRAFCAA